MALVPRAGVLDKDHSAVKVDVSISIPSCDPVRRTCFNFGKAKWSELRAALKSVTWASFFSDLSADEAAAKLTQHILDAVKQFVPLKTIESKPYKHPWIDDECRELLRKKHAAIGTPAFAAARDACTHGFSIASSKHLADTRKKLSAATSRDWWKLS